MRHNGPHAISENTLGGTAVPTTEKTRNKRALDLKQVLKYVPALFPTCDVRDLSPRVLLRPPSITEVACLALKLSPCDPVFVLRGHFHYRARAVTSPGDARSRQVPLGWQGRQRSSRDAGTAAYRHFHTLVPTREPRIHSRTDPRPPASPRSATGESPRFPPSAKRESPVPPVAPTRTAPPSHTSRMPTRSGLHTPVSQLWKDAVVSPTAASKCVRVRALLRPRAPLLTLLRS
jgi:hypothetical protein